MKGNNCRLHLSAVSGLAAILAAPALIAPVPVFAAGNEPAAGVSETRPIANPADAEAEAFVRRHVTHLNQGDIAAITRDWEAGGTIVDGFPPFQWDGPGPARRWYDDMMTGMKAHGFTRSEFTIDRIVRIATVGDFAYVALDAHANISGTAPVTLETRGVWTFVLLRQSDGWKIRSWSWGGTAAAPRP